MSFCVPHRVIVYIDGFNLYYGLRAKKYKRYYWLNMQKLSKNLLKKDQKLAVTKYFTTRISGAVPGINNKRSHYLDEKRQRQSSYLEALSTVDDIVMREGHYLNKNIKCHHCGQTWSMPEEKMTDVSIATEMLCDGFNDLFDTAMLISGDSDLTPPVLAIREFFPEKRIVVAFPPKRSSKQLKRVCHANFTIGRLQLSRSQFPDEVVTSDGHVLKRPLKWR